MLTRYWPLGAGRKVTSPFGPRSGGTHTGCDFGRDGGSAGMAVYAIQAGTVIFAGAAQGYGGPDPAGWLVIDSNDAEGGGCLEYGHIVRAVKKGDRVAAGQLIGHINPDTRTNGGVAPHLHVSDMPREYNPGTKQDPLIRLRGALEPGQPVPSPSPPAETKPAPSSSGGNMTLSDPFTGQLWSPNRYSPRGLGNPRWIAIHTQEGPGTADSLAGFLANPASQVSYHAVCDDRKLLKIVAEGDAPWSAAGANKYAFHLCLAGTYAGWSRGKWLETDTSDGRNEDVELTNAARIVAWWCQKYRIPPVWIGGGSIPPWGREGICGHADFGDWGGGHHDPGPNFPKDELIRRVNVLLGGASAPPPIQPPAPVVVPGTDPGQYAGWLLYRGRIGQDIEQVKRVQSRLKRAYASYAGHLVVDGDYGPQTEAAVREFQRRSGLTIDGIVGPATAAALKP